MRKILIANRGEIAVRVIRACRDMGLGSVAIFSECDRTARHVRLADEAVAIGGNPPSESYLHIERILAAARLTGADAIHPGYGFLSENEQFAAACRDAGLTFIGPSPEAVALVGSKTAARRIAAAAGVPTVRGSDRAFEADVDETDIRQVADAIGYPLLIKAVAGGGGKGMRVVTSSDGLRDAVRAARSEAGSAFGDASVYLEQFLTRPRHVEIQILADHHGAVCPFVERECSIQRRHQKVIEESPSPVVDSVTRGRLAEAASAVARAAHYTNAGTVEFLLDESGRFYFLEVNARLQVEHPITEMVTGIDLVQWQIRIARGERLGMAAETALTASGHAIECRVYAEDPDVSFLPSPGRLTGVRPPSGPGIRDDSWVETGTEVPIFYDSLLSKVIAWGRDRPEATARMRRALDEYELLGVRSSLPFSRWVLAQPEFSSARFHTRFLDELLQQRGGEPFFRPDSSLDEVAAVAACLIESSASSPPGLHYIATAAHGSGGSPRDGAAVAERSWKAQARREGLRP